MPRPLSAQTRCQIPSRSLVLLKKREVTNTHSHISAELLISYFHATFTILPREHFHHHQSAYNNTFLITELISLVYPTNKTHSTNIPVMTWSIQNIDGHLPRQVWESFSSHHVAAGIMLGTLVISLSYSLLHKIYTAKSFIYREELSRFQQTIVLQHSVEAILLCVLYIPYTFITISINFEEQPLESLADRFVVLVVFTATIITMYLIELAMRFVSQRPIILVHHLCAFFDAILTGFLLDTANIKAASLLNYFITYEAFLFVGLVMYRLAPTHKLTRPVIWLGMIIFGLSRPVQCIWIFGALWASWEELIVWEAVLQIILTIMFTSLQLYSLTIHYTLSKKARGRRKAFLYEKEALASLESKKESSIHMESHHSLNHMQETERTHSHEDGEDEASFEV